MENLNSDYIRLIISDLHLGSAHSQDEKLLKFINNQAYDELILAGDILEFLRKPEFSLHAAELFNKLLVGEKKTIYIVGNHDDAFNKFIGQSVSGIQFVKEYEFEYCGRRFRIQHGDQYDTGIVKWHYAIGFVSFVQNMLERVFKIDLTTWWANRQIKKRSLKRIWDLVKWNEDADVFIMGHTHNPEVLIWVDKNEKIKTYINTGDWIDNCTYVIIKDGQVRLRKWEGKG